MCSPSLLARKIFKRNDEIIQMSSEVTLSSMSHGVIICQAGEKKIVFHSSNYFFFLSNYISRLGRRFDLAIAMVVLFLLWPRCEESRDNYGT